MIAVAGMVPARWSTVFHLDAPVAELLVRASILYLVLVVVFRAGLRRDLGRLRVADLLMIFLTATAVRQALTGPYYSIADGLITLGTLLVWDLALDYAAYRWTPVHRLLSPDPRVIVSDGRIRPRNAQRALLTRADIMQELRQQGISSLRDVHRLYLEPDGKLSVIKRES